MARSKDVYSLVVREDTGEILVLNPEELVKRINQALKNPNSPEDYFAIRNLTELEAVAYEEGRLRIESRGHLIEPLVEILETTEQDKTQTR